MTPDELKEMIYSTVKEVLSEIKEEMKPDEQDTLITRDEAAKLLRVSKTTLYHWGLNGKLGFYKIGRKVYYKRNEVLSSLERERI